MLKPLYKKRAFETPLERGFGRRPFFTVAWGDAALVSITQVSPSVVYGSGITLVAIAWPERPRQISLGQSGTAPAVERRPG